MTDTTLNPRDSLLDWPLIGALALLMFVGVAFIFSATMVNDAAASLPWYRQKHILQMIWYAAGIAGAVVLCLTSYQTIARWSFVVYWVTILLLIAVLIPGIGSLRYGARRWIDLGFFQFQPSEFAKLTFILAMGHFLSRPADELRQPKIFFTALGMTLLPFALILKEPDLGSALTLLPVALVMSFAAGVPAKFLRRLLAGVGILIALLLVDVLFAPPSWQIKLEDYQRKRLLVYFGQDFAPRTATAGQRERALDEQRKHSYNVEQALISVGSGGLTGQGWRQGTQNALGYLPRGVAHNDFIFSVIAEESGFVGSVIVITLYTVVLFSGLRVAGQARDRLGKLLAVGVVTLLFSHVFINIGMNIRLMPVTGIPLPLLSYGGSSVLCSLIAAGLLQNIHIHRRVY
ncbi:MAG TPA: rod shape-determining protein RodA [Verrucomicrobiae bacterium]|jgi:rod shape determining protein RodA